MAPEGAARDGVPTRTAAGCVSGDAVRGPFPRPPSHAMDAFPVMAVGCPIRARWRSGRSNHGAESGAGRSSHGSLVPAQRLAFSRPLEGITVIDRDHVFAASGRENRPDPAGRLERVVSPPLRISLPCMSLMTLDGDFAAFDRM
jgi:hypothetical protein